MNKLLMDTKKLMPLQYKINYFLHSYQTISISGSVNSAISNPRKLDKFTIRIFS
jgi:hypothetical protein